MASIYDIHDINEPDNTEVYNDAVQNSPQLKKEIVEYVDENLGKEKPYDNWFFSLETKNPTQRSRSIPTPSGDSKWDKYKKF